MINQKRKYQLLILLLGCIHSFCIAANTTLSLDSSIKLAQNNNKQILQADLQRHKAQQLKQQAFTKYFPQITASAVGYHSLHPIVEIGVNHIESATVRDLLNTLYGNYGQALGLDNSIKLFQYGYQAGVTALQPIYTGGKIVIGNKLAQIGVQAAQLQYQITSRDILQEVEETYWMLVGLNDKKQTIHTSTLLLDTLHQTIQQAVSAGLTLETDLLLIELKQAEIQRTQIQLNNALQLAKRALCLAIGIPFNDSIIVDSIQHLTSTQEYNIPPIQYASTPEHQLLALQLQAAQLQRKMTRAEALPQIAIGAHYGYAKFQTNLLNDDLGSNTGNGAVFVTISVPITAWWETSHKMNIEQQNIKIAQLQQTQNDELLSMRTLQAFQQLNEAKLMVHEYQKALNITLQHYHLTSSAYQAGQKTIAELLEAQVATLKAKNELTDAIIAFHVNQRRYTNLINPK